MNCAEIEEKLSAYLDGELAGEDRTGVDAHVAACADCRRVLEALRLQHADLDAAFSPARAGSDALIDRVIAAVHRETPAARPRVTWLTPVLAAAAGFLVAFAFFRQTRTVTVNVPEKGKAAIAPDPVKKPMGRLAVATGAVEYRTSPEVEWQPLATGAGIEKNLWIRTVGKSKCSFDYNDGTEIRLNGDTEIHIETIRKIALHRGQIFTKVSPNEIKFQVRTDQTQIEALGTVLDIAHVVRSVEGHEKKEAGGRHVTTLTVLEGSALMGDKTVQTGYMCRMVDGRLAAPDKAYDLALMTKWVNEIVALRGDDAELSKRVNEMLAMIGRTKLEYLYEEEIRALGNHCVLPLTRYIQSTDAQKDKSSRRRASRILADIAGPPSVGDFVKLLRDTDPEVRVSIAKGLERITGETQGLDEKYWRGEDVGKGCNSWESHIQRPDSPWSTPDRNK